MGGPLSGLRILDLSRLLPGPFCSLLLADLGAEVLKVEDTGLGDYLRWAPPYYEGVQQSSASAMFMALNRNKRSIRLDLKQEPGRDVLLRLVATHDVLLESFRPGVLERLGIGYERCAEANARLIWCAISGYGQDGPLRDRAGHDMNYLALNGLLGLTGEAGGAPIQAAGQIADIGGGAMMAAVAILAALRERDGDGRVPGSGRGRMLDIAMADGALSWLAMVAGSQLCDEVPPQRGHLPLAGGFICYRPYECADGWVALGALEPKFWQAFCAGVGRPDLLQAQFAPPGGPEHEQVQALFRGRTREQWADFARGHDCCLEPVLELPEALAGEQVAAREMIVELPQPGAQRPVRQLACPISFSDGERASERPGARSPDEQGREPQAPARRRRSSRGHPLAPAPALGEHTEQVLGELGYSAAVVAELIERKAALGPPAAAD